jgi:hypothetical protein
VYKGIAPYFHVLLAYLEERARTSADPL